MRKPNTYSEFNSQRRAELLRNFRQSLARQSYISACRAFQDAVEAPASRFWVSEERATEVISKMLAGIDVVSGMYREKAEMYLEIYRRVVKLRKIYPDLPLCRIVFKVVNSEAPRSYMSLANARRIIKIGNRMPSA